MNTTDRNTKVKKKVEYKDIFENNGKGKDTEIAEKQAKKNKMDQNLNSSIFGGFWLRFGGFRLQI